MSSLSGSGLRASGDGDRVYETHARRALAGVAARGSD
jgi:hypothetical protein